MIMNGRRANGFGRKFAAYGNRAAIGAVVIVSAMQALAQNSAVQQKLAEVRQAVAENKQKLSEYQWIETTQITMNGDSRPPSQSLCRYDPDGQVQKTPLGAPPPPPEGGRLKQRIVEKKKEEMETYLTDVKDLLAQYTPPDPQKMEQAFKAGKVSLNPAGSIVSLSFTDYAQRGDRMTLSFDTATRKIVSLNIDTYMGKAKYVVTLQAQMASLPDGTNYVQQTILNATGKRFVSNTTSSSYQRLGVN
jgi:hypothetical protein